MLQHRLSAHFSLNHNDIKNARFSQRAFFMATNRLSDTSITDLHGRKGARQHSLIAAAGRQQYFGRTRARPGL